MMRRWEDDVIELVVRPVVTNNSIGFHSIVAIGMVIDSMRLRMQTTVLVEMMMRTKKGVPVVYWIERWKRMTDELATLNVVVVALVLVAVGNVVLVSSLDWLTLEILMQKHHPSCHVVVVVIALVSIRYCEDYASFLAV
jgi:hypothetical protein